MILAALFSFLLEWRFSREAYVPANIACYILLNVALCILLSFLSVGVPTEVISGTTDAPEPSYTPLPVSFPFYSIGRWLPSWGAMLVESETYELYFLNVKVAELGGAKPLYQSPPSLISYTIIQNAQRMSRFYQYFLTINIAGGIIGYWINRKTLSLIPVQ